MSEVLEVENLDNGGSACPMSDISDSAVIAKVLAGDKDQFRILVERYQSRVYGMIMRQTGNSTIAEDISQEAFVRAFLALGKFRGESEFSTWLIRIALNAANVFVTSARYRDNLKAIPFDIDKHDLSATETGEHIRREFALDTFHRALLELKPRFKDVITLCGLEGRSYEEAAAILNIPIGTVRSRLNKARLLLRSKLSRQSEEKA